MDFKRCVIHWLMGNGCRARGQYGFSEMTEPWGITLKSAPDISRLALYYTRSRSFSLFSLFFSHSHILTFPSFPSVSASSSLLILLFFSLSPPPSLPLFHCPQTACWLNKWPSFILRKQLSFMKTLAVDRACGKAWASDLSVRDGWQFSPHPLRTAMEEKSMREVRKVVTRPSAVSST